MKKILILSLVFAGGLLTAVNMAYAINFAGQIGKTFQSNECKIHKDLKNNCPDKQAVVSRGGQLIHLSDFGIVWIKGQLAYLEQYTYWSWVEFKNTKPYKNYVSEFEHILKGGNYISPKDFVKYVLPLYTPKMRNKYSFYSPFPYKTTNDKYYDGLPYGDPEKIAGVYWRLNKYLGKKHPWYYTRLSANGIMTCSRRDELHNICRKHGFNVNGKSGVLTIAAKKKRF
ncbi:hypothetical protein KC460_01735 [Candidatus Dependentiae bacterium]|nr:hypothetical protein [Candidatus Dependentiae bacterium]